MGMTRDVAARGARVFDRTLEQLDRTLPWGVPFRSRDIARILLMPRPLHELVRRARGGVVHTGQRADLRRVNVDGLQRVAKTFADDEAGRRAMEIERAADVRFAEHPWKLPILQWLDDGYLMPALPAGARLDLAAAHLTAERKRELAVEALSIALDVYVAGAAHRDFHAGNLYLYQDQLLLSDFETLADYEGADGLPFAESYDVSGQGLDSPFDTDRMCFGRGTGRSLDVVLGVPVADALDGLRERLRDELREAARSFMRTRADFGRRAARHQCERGDIYSSFELPGLAVPPSETQRNTAQRMLGFGLGPGSLAGRTVLDLGCHSGAVSLTAHGLGATRCLGVEYDAEKVDVANRIARFCGAAGVRFQQGNVDELTAADVGGGAEIVFCLAIERHVADPRRLYRLLAEVTSDTLYFEGNAGCDVVEVERRLSEAGFASVRHLGFGSDDRIAENNQRPLIVARKPGA